MPSLVRSSLLACLVAVVPGHGLIADTRTWNGSAGTDFESAANWSLLPVDDLATDLALFSGPAAAVSQPSLSASRGIAGLRFNTIDGGWTLGSAAPGLALAVGASGISTNGQTSGVNTISADLVTAATQTWAAGAGGTLVFTGSITGSTGLPLTFGTTTDTGTVILSPAAGRSINLNGATSAGMLLLVRTAGQLVLGGDGVRAPVTASVNTITSTGTFGALTATGAGVVEVNSGTWSFGDLGRNGTSDFLSGTLSLKGGDVTFNGARFLSSGTVSVSGGTLRIDNTGSIYTNGGKFALGSAGTTGYGQLLVSGGTLDLAQANGTANGGNSLGVAISAKAIQTGGTVRSGITVGGGTNGGTTNTLTIGTTGMTSTGSGATLTFTPISNVLASYTLSGGTLLSAGAIQGMTPASAGTNGASATPPGVVVQPGTGNLRNFNFAGGVLATASFVATNLGYASATGLVGGPLHADPAANSVGLGTLHNLGGTLAPGGVGTAGRTSVTGNYTVLAGTLAVDLGGTVAATGFQTGEHDLLAVSGATALGGDLQVGLLPGFTPAAGQTFTILTSTGGVSGEFANVVSGGRVVTVDGFGTLVVTVSANNVVLSDYLPVAAPVISSASAPSAFAAGDSVVFGVAVDSLSPVTYVWRKGGVVIPGAVSSALTLVGIQQADTGAYEVTATNAVGSVTRTFNLALTVPVTAGSVVVDAGSTTVIAATPGAASYEWTLDGVVSGTGPTFSYSPTSKAVGTHWLRVRETPASGPVVVRDWCVRVRLTLPTPALAYYVSPTGSDTANGSLGAPFRTLEKARDTIRLLSKPLPAGGVTVYLRGGVHRRTTTFSLTSSDSGTATAPIVYAAYPGETPVLTGARTYNAAQFAALAASEQSRVAPGVDVSRIWELDVTGNARAATFPSVFNEWTIFNAQRSTLNGGLFEVFYSGTRMPLSRYPNPNPDDTLTQSLTMDGVAQGVAADGSGYLNASGTYTDSNGTATAVSAAFQYRVEDAARIARWQTALSKGGVWLAGLWRVPWQLNAAKVALIDTGVKRTIGFATAAAIPNGIGSKYQRPVGSRAEPYWALNLLEELDQPGEWCIDFNRKKLYFLMDGPGAPPDGSFEIADLSTPLVQLNGASDVALSGLTFRRQLGHTVQILNGARALVLGCDFSQSGNAAIDINGGTGHGVVSCDFADLASGGILLRGGTETPVLAASDQFVVNNRIERFGQVVRVYQGAIDTGYGGPLGTSKTVSVGTRIAHNYLSTTPHGGLYWNGYNHVIEYNEIADFVRVSNDMGAIYRFGPNFQSDTVIRFNHAHHSPQGEAFYNDFDHVKVATYGNVSNLHTPATSSRGYGFWCATNTAVGGAVPGLTMALNLRDNISVNGRGNFQLHSSTGGVIANNLAYSNLSYDFSWRSITTNTTTLTHTTSSSTAAALGSGPNLSYASDPGFVDFANDDLRLRPDARAYTDMPGFTPGPLEMMGLYNDEFRSDARTFTPFVTAAAATDIGANTATLTGSLAYPLFEANATVTVFWGTIDGGTDPLAWQSSASLGLRRSGQLAYTPTSLAPDTRHYFRFRAVNSAGTHWSEVTGTFTTFPLAALPLGSATAGSSSGTAVLAIDGNPATAWRTATGVTTTTFDLHLAGTTGARLTQYELTSAADSPASDPRDWRVLGSYDGVAWVQVDTRSGETFASRGLTRSFGFASGNTFRHFRLEITANNGDATGTQLAEFRVLAPTERLDTLGPIITTPGDLSVVTTAAGANVVFSVSALDAVSGSVAAVATPASGSLFPIGNTTVTVTATDAAGNTSTASFVITVSYPVLPSPWLARQVGSSTNALPGNASFDAGTGVFSVTGGGGDIWSGTNESFTFIHQPWVGDGTFTARVASFSSSDSAAKAGIMLRETMAVGARNSIAYLTRGGSFFTQHKTSPGANVTTTSATGRAAPEWVRLVRAGNEFSGYVSDNGTAWTQVGATTVNPMTEPTVYVGLAVGPRTVGTASTVTFDNVSFLSPVQVWRSAKFGVTAPEGNAADLADPDGDGQANLLEYALGTEPVVASAADPITRTAVDSHLILTFNRTADPLLLYVVEAADTPSGPWTEVWSSTGSANVAGVVTVADATPVSTGAATRFLRLRVEMQ